MSKKKTRLEPPTSLNFHSLIHPFGDAATLPECMIGVGKELAFNIYECDFNLPKTSWGDINNVYYKTLISILIDAAHDNGETVHLKEVSEPMGKVILYLKGDIPRFIIVFEELKSSNEDDKDFKGWRFWYKEIDSGMDIPRKIVKAIELGYNRYTAAIAKKTDFTSSTQFDNLYEARFKSSNGSPENQSVLSFVRRVMAHTTHNRDLKNLINESTDKEIIEKGITSPDSPFYIYSAYSVVDAFENDNPANFKIKEEQMDITKYYNVDLGLGFCGSSFTGYPLPRSTFRLKASHFTNYYLCCAQLPSVSREFICERQKDKDRVILEIQKTNNMIKSCTEVVSNLKETRSRQGSNPKVEQNLKQAQEELEKAIERKRELSTALASLEKQIDDTTSSPPGTSGSFFANTSKIDGDRELLNRIIYLRRKNHEKQCAILSRHLFGSPEYRRAILAHYKEACAEFMDVFMTSENVSAGTHAVRDFLKKLKKKDSWSTYFTSLENMSPYASFRTRLHQIFDKVMQCEANHQLTMLAVLSCFSAPLASPIAVTNPAIQDQRNHLLFAGLPGYGKSFILESVKNITVPGTTVTIANLTDKAFTGKGDYSDLNFLLHEIPVNWFAATGKNGTGENYLVKTALSEGRVETLEMNFNETTKDREVKHTTSHIHSNFQGSTNYGVPQDHPTAQRLIRPDLAPQKREDHDPFSNIIPARPEEQLLAQREINSLRLLHAYTFILFKAIEACAMPEIDVASGMDVMRIVFDKEINKSIPIPSTRKQSQLRRNLVCVTAMYAVWLHLFSENGIKHMRHNKDKETSDEAQQNNEKKDQEENGGDEDDDLKGFDHTDLFSIITNLVCTEEIIVDVLTLHEMVLCPESRWTLIELIAREANAETVTEMTSFRKIPNPDSKSSNNGNGDTFFDPVEDLDYISIPCGQRPFHTLDALNSRSKVSTKRLHNELLELMNSKITVYDKEKIEDEDKKGLYRIQEDRDKPPRVIECAKKEIDPYNENKYRLILSWDLINHNKSSKGRVLGELMKTALAHKNCGERTYITSYYAKREVEGEKDVYHTHHKVLDTITIPENPDREISIYNPNYMSDFQEQILLRHSFDVKDVMRKVDGSGNIVYEVKNNPNTKMSEVMKERYFVLERPLDEVNIGRYIEATGIDGIEGFEMVLPHVALKKIKELRNTSPELKELIKANNVRFYDNYPEDFIEECKKEKKMDKDIRTKKATPSIGYSKVIGNDVLSIVNSLTSNPKYGTLFSYQKTTATATRTLANNKTTQSNSVAKKAPQKPVQKKSPVTKVSAPQRMVFDDEEELLFTVKKTARVDSEEEDDEEDSEEELKRKIRKKKSGFVKQAADDILEGLI